jgi:hypothetical protein
MNDTGEVVRKAFYDALNNVIAIPGDPVNKVPIVDEKLDLNISEHDLYMLIGGQQTAPANNKTVWADEVDLSITITNRRKATNSKTTIENIATQMLQTLFPTRTTVGITITAPFRLSYVKRMSDQYTFEKAVDGWIISKQIIFKTRITQTP